jgi:hypothetical protein
MFVIGLAFLSTQGLFGIPKEINYIIPGIIIAALGNGPALVISMPELLIYGKQAAIEGTNE